MTIERKSSTRSGDAPKTHPDFEPQFHCRHMSIPIEVIELIGTPITRAPSRNGVADKFTHTHAILLGYIDMMVDWRGHGCWATNAYLGRMIGRSGERVKQLIQDCKKLGLVVDRGEQEFEYKGRIIRRRVLETSWSRLPQEGGNRLPGRGGNLLPTDSSIRKDRRETGAARPETGPRAPAEIRPKRRHRVDEDGSSGFPDAPIPTAIKPCPIPAPPRAAVADAIPGEGLGYPVPSGIPAPPPVDKEDAPTGGRPVDELIPPAPTAKDARPKCRTDAVDHARADKLRGLARRMGWGSSASPRSWEEPLALLARSMDSAARSNIDTMIDWYVAWYQRGKRPALRNGAQFREHYAWLCAVREREAADAPPAVVCETAQAILDDALNEPWPKGAETRLPGVVARSVAAMRDFLARGRKAALTGRLGDLWGEILAAELGEVRHHLTQWFERAGRRVRGWDDWSGNVAMFEWRPDHPDLIKMLGEYLRDRPGAWDQILSALGYKEIS